MSQSPAIVPNAPAPVPAARASTAPSRALTAPASAPTAPARAPTTPTTPARAPTASSPTVHTSYLSDDASQPTKKHAIQSQSSQPTVIFGPFSPPSTSISKVVPPRSSTIKSAQSPSVWKNPPNGSAKDSSVYKNEIPAKHSSTISRNIPSITSVSLKYPSTSSSHIQPSIAPSNPPSRYISPNIPARILPSSHIQTSTRASQNNQTEQKSGEESKENSKALKSLRSKLYSDWPLNVDFDDKEEVVTIDPPTNKMDPESFKNNLDHGGGPAGSWQELVIMNADYRAFLQHLAPPVKFHELGEAPRSENLPYEVLKIRYATETGHVVETLEEAPREFRHAQNELPVDFQRMTRD